MSTIMGDRDINDKMRLKLNLLARMIGMLLLNPNEEVDQEYQNSIAATVKLTAATLNQHP